MTKPQTFAALALGAALSASLLVCAAARADTATVTINAITAEGIGAEIGTATVTDGKDGAAIAIEIKGLSAGEHGMHVHEKGDCAAGEKDGKKVAGLAAGPHFDPGKAGKHEGPAGAGHMGDLPKLMIEGASTKAALVAPKVKVADIAGRALIIHEGGDTYSDTPDALGGGKGRIACGVIQAAK
ncbi:MAG: superoxide dismutase family protein [Hyphomicrobium sp.]